MSKHKIRYILPLLAVMASAACVGAAGSSDKTNEKDAKQQNRAICPGPVNLMSDDCLSITLGEFDSILQASARNGRLTKKNFATTQR